MNRIIKFRAWDNKRNRMYSTDEFHYDGEYQDINFSVHFPEEEDEATRWDLRTEDLVLLQFTGLLDTNGKEIYEGDIVKSDGLLGIVEYDEADAQFKVESDYHDGPLVAHHDMDELEYEVIGNIYENPELIK